MVIIADSSPLISLACIGKLELLNKSFDDFYIPKEVFNEVTESGKPYSEELRILLESHIKNIKDGKALKILSSSVDLGEAAAIVLALECEIRVVLIDDYKARKMAEINDLQPIGTIGLLLKAKEKGYIKSV